MTSLSDQDLTREIEEAKGRWRQAQSFDEICELHAQFMEGRLKFIPGYGATELDGESTPIRPYLAELNRAGFLTLCSQPGVKEAAYQQRAFVDGVAQYDVADAIKKVMLHSDLLVVVAQPRELWDYPIPVTVAEFQPFTWAGHVGFFDEEKGVLAAVREYAEICSEQVIRELRTACEICVIDLCWGREWYLWEVLAQALCYSNVPHPELYLDEDEEFDDLGWG